MLKNKTSLSRIGDVFDEVNDFSSVQRFAGLSALIYFRGRFRTSINWLIANLIIISCVLIINFNTIFTTRKEISYHCSLYYYLSIAQFFSICSGIVGNLIQCIRKVNFLNRCLFNIRAVDLVLFSLGKKRPYTKINFSILFVLASIVTAWILRLHLHTSLSVSFNMFFMYVIHSLVVLIYLFIDRMASLLLLSFKSISQSLIKCSEMDGKKAALLAEKLIYCHHKLCNSSRDFNEFSSIQILIILTVEFVTSFAEVYVVICVTFNDRLVTSKIILILIKILWSLVAITLLWQISHQFVTIRNEAKEFNQVLYQIMINDQTNEILNNPKLKLHIAMNREVVFTAYGFFNLDYSLLHSIIASSTTYLVILIQFSEEPTTIPSELSSASIGNITTTPSFLTTL